MRPAWRTRRWRCAAWPPRRLNKGESMRTLHFHTPAGEPITLEAQDGLSVMEAAVAANVPGIDAECGGACACATCHVYVDESWAARLPERTDIEVKMLEFA